ncbi:hypothetical protein D9M68_428720 [compost metagenome]
MRAEAFVLAPAFVGRAARTNPEATPMVSGERRARSPVNGAHGAPYGFQRSFSSNW